MFQALVSQIGGLLAQGADAAPAGGGGAPDQGTQLLVQFMLPLVMLVAMYYLMIGRPQQREQAKRQAMLDGLKKNDKVLTIGGAIGHVADISSDGKRVTVRFGENTRITFLRSSIQQVVTEDEEAKLDPPKS